MEQLVSAFYKNSKEQVHVILKDFKGRDLIDLRVFWTQDGRAWHPSKKGIAMSVEKLPALLAALHKAAEMVGQEQYEQQQYQMVEDELLTTAEKSQLIETFGLDADRIEESILE